MIRRALQDFIAYVFAKEETHLRLIRLLEYSPDADLIRYSAQACDRHYKDLVALLQSDYLEVMGNWIGKSHDEIVTIS